MRSHRRRASRVATEPRATYRLQLSAAFPLAAARQHVPYLARLGVSHVYSSPLLAARRGSEHGYDVTDPTRINPEIGTERELRAFVALLRRHGLGLILDIVPNHMAVSEQNPAWDDVLAHGRCSRFASWFDVDWEGGAAGGRERVVLPVLGDEYAHVLDRGELRPTCVDGVFRLRYFEHSFPLDPVSLTQLLAAPGVEQRRTPAARHQRELESMAAALRDLPSGSGPARVRRREQVEAAERRLRALCQRSMATRRHVAAVLGRLGRPAGRPALHRLLDAQAYRLIYWRRAGQGINYRRFFSINDLVAVRTGDPRVFAATHAHVLEWVGEGLVDGLRIDHIDGLRDPAGYLRRLRRTIGKVRGAGDFPVYVEKILSAGERLPDSWPVRGTTGYEFIAEAEPVWRDARGVGALDAWYARSIARGSRFGSFADGFGSFADVVVAAKSRMLQTELAADVERLRRLLPAGRSRSLSAAAGRRALVAVVAQLPVYRTYVDRRGRRLSAQGRRFMNAALSAAGRHADPRDRPGLERLARLLLRVGKSSERMDFIERLQQTSGAAMAKGLEDTAHYVWVPLASRNEVGTAPGPPQGDAVSRFHAASAMRARTWPGGMLCVSTHDTKRSADVRGRLDVLSEVADLWTEHVGRWRELNHRGQQRASGRASIDPNTEYLLYQTLVGIWPASNPDTTAGGLPAARQLASLRDRVVGYMVKAVREAKVRTSWTDPDVPFEHALERFTRRLLDPRTSAVFLHDLQAFVDRIALPGLCNAMARTLVQLTAPGVPDTYQGDELWNFSLVDPDNRRAVDFTMRRLLLERLERAERRRGRGGLVRDLQLTPHDGRLKLHVLRTALELRGRWPVTFASGSYTPLTARGRRARHVVAFVRRHGGHAVLVVVPRLVGSLLGPMPALPPGAEVWGDTTLELPRAFRGVRLRNEMTHETVLPRPSGNRANVRVGELLGEFPVALAAPAGRVRARGGGTARHSGAAGRSGR